MQIGLGALLGVVLIVLKLTETIDWSWIWVLSPFWISISLSLIVMSIMGIIAAIIVIKDSR